MAPEFYTSTMAIFVWVSYIEIAIFVIYASGSISSHNLATIVETKNGASLKDRSW